MASVNDIEMTYGSYRFEPIPLITYTEERIIDAINNKLFDRVTIGCNGALVNLPIAGHPGGDADFGRLDDGYFTPLVSGLAQNHQELIITHQSGVLVSGVFPRIEGFSTEEDVWVNKLRYNFSFVYDKIADASGVVSYSDTWSFAETENDTATVNHSVAAVGLNTTPNSASNALTNAKDFVTPRLGTNNVPTGFPGVVFSSYNDLSYIKGLTQESINEATGEYSVQESYVLASGLALTFFDRSTMEFSKDSAGITTIGVNGQIQGNGDTAFWRDKNAFAAWNNTVRDSLFAAASGFHTDIGATRILGNGFLSESITRNKNAGTISYRVDFNDLINDVHADGIIDATFSVTNQRPVDVFAVIAVPGKDTGPVWQNLSTTTEGSFTLTGQVIGENTLKAKVYAQYLILTYGGQSVGTKSRIVSMSVDPDEQHNTVSFNVTWAYTGDGATSTIP